jgi:EAL domain-containing protein (putative c-di-GMP-specific phosphodiesterase class I)/DNA-binding NarL/FixJ family response regulator
MEPTESSQSRPTVAALSQGPVVVVADDDSSLRAFYRTALERAGFQVLPARNGRQALELVRSNSVAVLLLDLAMPGLTGLEAVQELRADPALRTLPVIIATGSAGEADRVTGLDQGADDVVVKPISAAELVARVRAQIRGQTAVAEELNAGRENRRRLAALLSELPRQADLIGLARALAERLPAAVGVDGAAILAFERGATRCIAASSILRDRFPPARLLPHDVGAEIAQRASGGPWLQRAPHQMGLDDESIELGFVPFSLAELAAPIGCLVYSRTDGMATPLARRLADLIDTTELTVAALRPAVEHAETTNAAILHLRKLIARRQFAVHLQPISRLDTGELFGFEALTRFDDGVRPDIRFAEATRLGLGQALERATLGGAIEAVASMPADVALSMNVSPDVLRHERSLPQLIDRAQRPVILELTEHERIDDYDAIRASFARLGPKVRLAVDDAGSGYASLKHILRLQPSYVKLDMEWVRGIDQDPVRRSLVSGLAYFADVTRSELIAEGIETEAERVALLELGVKLGQGFLLGRPAPTGGRTSTGPIGDLPQP